MSKAKSREYFLKVKCVKCGATLMLGDAVADTKGLPYHRECAPKEPTKDEKKERVRKAMEDKIRAKVGSEMLKKVKIDVI